MRTCGLFFQEKIESPRRSFVREQRLPRLSISAHTRILSSVARTVLTQTFINTTSKTIDVALYTFPLFDGISVVGFTCTINESRVIRGVVKEKEEALKTFNDAVARGETAGLLGRHPNAIDVFRTTIGNIPPGANVKVDIVYLEELKHDAQTDSIRFTLPTSIAPRYWGHSSRDITLQEQDNVAKDAGIDITVDIEMPTGSAISSLQSPSHPIAITIGSLSAPSTDHPTRIHSPELASATLALGTTSMDKDFVLQIHAANTSDPVAILETHPTIPNQRALMTTLVPKFNLPFQRPEIVFICDRSGSMQGTKIANLRSALRLFLASLPLGIKFNICGFGGDYEFLFPNSIPYNAQSREAAMDYTDHMDADFGGTEIKDALVDTFERRDKSMNLGVFLLTDGQVMQPEAVIAQVKRYFEDSKGAIRVFTLGIGKQASHHMLEALARAGRGFAQKAGDDEKVDKKVIYMLKAAMMPHIDDYTLEVKYRTRNQESDAHSDDFELIDDISTELTSDSLPMELTAGNSGEQEGTVTVDTPMKPISLFDANFDPDTKIEDLESLVGEDQLLSMETPATIQVPCPIPPLYPSNRTSVYLILSPDEGDKIPESVVLRGTSPNGPLELEIPVTITSGGETVHQLAARKALQDLEEERSWLHVLHRENRNNPRVMLDNTYEDRFSDLVKREAVRLGVKFQVDGKWCSFVAVQDNDREERTPSTNDTDPTTIVDHLPTISGSTSTVGVLEYRHLLRGSPICTAGPTVVSIKKGKRAPSSQGLPQSTTSSPRLARPAVGDRFNPVSRARVGMVSNWDETAAHPMSVATFSDEPPARDPETSLQRLVRLQDFSGYWEGTADVLGIIGLSEKDLTDMVDRTDGSDRAAITTVAVLAFLRKQMASEKEVWDLMDDKAFSWLQSQKAFGTEDKVEEVITALEKVLV